MLRMVPRWSRSPGTLCLCHMEVWGLVSYLNVLVVSPTHVYLTLRSPFQVASHHHIRNKVGLFDVGHMVQTKYANNPLLSLSKLSSHR